MANSGARFMHEVKIVWLERIGESECAFAQRILRLCSFDRYSTLSRTRYANDTGTHREVPMPKPSLHPPYVSETREKNAIAKVHSQRKRFRDPLYHLMLHEPSPRVIAAVVAAAVQA